MKRVRKILPAFVIIPEISHSDISGITTKAPCEAPSLSIYLSHSVPMPSS